MLREHIVSYLDSIVIFLLLTNAVSVAAAVYAVSIAGALNARGRDAKALVMGRTNAVLAAAWPSSSR